VPAREKSLAKSADVRAFEPTAEQFTQLEEIARVNLGETNDVLAALGADALSRAQFNVLQAGAYFLKLKDQAGHGGFLPALEKAGVNPRAAQEAMQIGAYIASLPADQAKRIAALPKSKVLPLINAEQDVVSELMSEGALDGDDALSVRELRQRLAKAEQARIKAEQTLELRTVENKALQVEAKRAYEGLGIERWCAAAREEAAIQSDVFVNAVDLLEDAWKVHVLGAERGALTRDAFQRQQHIAAGTLFHALGGVCARGAQLMDQISGKFGDAVTAGFNPEFALSPEEVARFDKLRKRIIDDAKIDHANREVERANATPGKRGRKQQKVGK
jgi:hypothetical protein